MYITMHIPRQMPEVQNPLTQSLGRLHFFLSEHRGHDLPPQSLSVSA